MPDTVVRWHRRAFALYWRWRSRPRRPGRPAVAVDIRALIRQMHAANPLWGAPRIHGELRKLGIEIAQSTVAKYLARRGGKAPSQTWRSFLRNHVSQLTSIDFFTVPTATFRVLFVFVVLVHDRRRIVHVNVTAHPNTSLETNAMNVTERDSIGWLNVNLMGTSSSGRRTARARRTLAFSCPCATSCWPTCRRLGRQGTAMSDEQYATRRRDRRTQGSRQRRRNIAAGL
ncbi:MAG: hypothetical protein IMZ69_00655 [Spirochaetes bacterium]|nr:hypothetical protein [Spirochaetota bacterium]